MVKIFAIVVVCAVESEFVGIQFGYADVVELKVEVHQDVLAFVVVGLVGSHYDCCMQEQSSIRGEVRKSSEYVAVFIAKLRLD